MKPTFLVLALAASCICESPLLAQVEAAAAPIDPSKTEFAMLTFCETAILKDRGLACSPWYGPTDKEIFEKWVTDERFLDALSASRVVLEFKRSDLSARRYREETGNLVGYFDRSYFAPKVDEALTESQRKKLAGVYLRIEGLMALCRPEFAPLFDEPGNQAKICKEASNAFQESAAPIYKQVFLDASLGGNSALYHATLRRASAELDAKIMRSLTQPEQRKLHAILINSAGLDDVIEARPPF